jgi:diamine N-acetyltransferase
VKKQFLDGNKVLLRAVEPEDLNLLYRIENDPELWDIGCFTVPYSKFLLKQYIANNQYDVFADKQLRLMIQLKETGSTVGTIDITDFNIQHSRGSIGIALLKEYRKSGLGNESVSLLCEYAFQFLHFHQLYALVSVDNLDSQALFSSCGFENEGILKEWLHIEDKWVDALIMQRINK